MSFESPHFPSGEEGDRLELLSMVNALIGMSDEDIEKLAGEAELSVDDIQVLNDLREWAKNRGTN